MKSFSDVLAAGLLFGIYLWCFVVSLWPFALVLGVIWAVHRAFEALPT